MWLSFCVCAQELNSMLQKAIEPRAFSHNYLAGVRILTPLPNCTLVSLNLKLQVLSLCRNHLKTQDTGHVIFFSRLFHRWHISIKKSRLLVFVAGLYILVHRVRPSHNLATTLDAQSHLGSDFIMIIRCHSQHMHP